MAAPFTSTTLRTASTLLLALLAAACAPADEAAEMDAETEADETAVPAPPDDIDLSGWTVRLDDESADPSGFGLVTADDGFRVTTGPAGVAWRPDDLVGQGDFTVSATFHETGSPDGHREAYGLIVGGMHLESPDQQYTYFLVRGDGSYLIKRRSGDATETLVDWSSSDAVSALASGDNENTLTVRVAGDQVEFAANGTVLETLPTANAEPWGLVGVRVNHRLDVEVSGWSVEGAAVGQGNEGG